MKTHFGKEWENVVTVEPLTVWSFMPNMLQKKEKSKHQEFYTELIDRQQLKTTISLI